LQPSFSSSVVVSESQLCWNHQHQLIELGSLWKESWNMSALKILWIQRLTAMDGQSWNSRTNLMHSGKPWVLGTI
jgi:exoribonuclease II